MRVVWVGFYASRAGDTCGRTSPTNTTALTPFWGLSNGKRDQGRNNRKASSGFETHAMYDTGLELVELDEFWLIPHVSIVSYIGRAYNIIHLTYRTDLHRQNNGEGPVTRMPFTKKSAARVSR